MPANRRLRLAIWTFSALSMLLVCDDRAGSDHLVAGFTPGLTRQLRGAPTT